MAIRPILEAPDPRLKRISAPVERFDDELKSLVADMFETMYDAPGIGLAAVQIDVPLRVVVVDLQDRGEPLHEPAEGEPEPERVPNPRVFINPELLDPSEELSVYAEGCLSVPEIYADVERPARVRLRWHDLDGARHEEELAGMMATCIQHEMDHLDGILFIDHLSRLKRNMVLKKLEKARKAA
ncbi:MAG: peptide deformylase [Sphingomonadales bacterium]|nr:peptide deformylase [Sphingomonadales bacterium]